MTPLLAVVRRAAVGLTIVMTVAGCGSASDPSTPSGASDVPPSAPSAFVPSAIPGVNAALIPTAPTGPVLSGSPLTAEGADAQFKLAIEADQDRYRAGQLIDVSSTLMYLGPNAGIVVGGSGTGLVLFTLERTDPSLLIDYAATADCRRYEIPARVAIEHPFVKSGGWGEQDPNAAFYRAYFGSPELRLPAGRWTITALTNFAEDECRGQQHKISASVTVSVEP